MSPRAAEDSDADLHLRRVGEEARRVGREQMLLVADSALDYAIITLDEAGLITAWSRGAESVFGYRAAEIIGQPGALLFLPEDRAQGVPEDEMRRARASGRAEDERWHLHKDGHRFYCSGVMNDLARAGGEGYVKIARDLTARQQGQAEREAILKREQAARAEAQAANRLKDDFLAILSHELKQPLNLIQINAELLARSAQTRDLPPVVRAAGTIRRAVASQAQIIDDMLDLSRMQTGKLLLNRDTIDLVAVCSTGLGAATAAAESAGIVLTADLPASPLRVLADPVRVEQIVWNLLSNAIKFTPSGGTIALRIARDVDAGLIEVRDTGKGIDPAFLPHLFEMFRQADARTTRVHGGLGIGLALVHQLVHLHGGRIEARSEGLGRGASFAVWLPLAEGRDVPAAAEAAPAAASFGGLRILLVEDLTDALDTLHELLVLEGAEVTGASSASEALQVAATEDFDLVVSDIAMPEMDGYAFLQRLRQSPRHAATPAVAITGFSRDEDARRAADAGFAACLRKPLSVRELYAAIHALLPARR